MKNDSSQTAPFLTIIIPAYHEAATIGATLETLAAYIARPGFPETEVIVSVGEGNDDTLGEAGKKAHLFTYFTVLDNGKPSDKGRNIKLAMAEARGEVCIYMDADLSTPLRHVEPMLAMLQKHDVVIAERDINAIHTGHRKFISQFGNVLVRMLLLPGMRDTQCGFKGFRRHAARQLSGRQRVISWAFDMELLALSKKIGYSIGTLRVPDWAEVNKGGELDRGAVKALKTAVLTFSDLLRIKWYIVTNVYQLPRLKEDVNEWNL